MEAAKIGPDLRLVSVFYFVSVVDNGHILTWVEANSFLSFSVLCVSFYDTAPFQQKSRDTGSQIFLKGVSKVCSDCKLYFAQSI